MNAILRKVVITGIFAILFIPLLVFNNLFFPFITSKNFVFRIIVEIIFGGWLILVFTDPTFRPRKSWILWALVAFVGVMFLADVCGVYPYKSLWSNFERMEGFVTLIHLALYTLVAATTLQTSILWRRFWSTSIGVSVLMCLYGYAQLAGRFTIHQGGVRLDGRMGNATYLAVYILIHIFLTAYLMVSRSSFSHKFVEENKIIIGSIIIILQSIILYYTATRGAILGLIGGVLITSILIIIFEKERRGIKKVSIGIVLASMIIIGGFISLRTTSFVQESPVLSRFSSISLSDSTTLSRFVLWRMAWEGFKERPLLGWGQENFNYVFNTYYDPVLYNQEQWFDRTHNVIFDWLIAGGILGLLTYLSLYAILLWYIWKGTHFTVLEKSILTGLLAGYFIHNLFVFDNLTSYILFFSLLAYVYARTSSSGPSPINIKITHNRGVAPIVLVALIIVIYIVNIQPIQASMRLIDAITPRQNGSVQANLQDFKYVINLDTFGTQEAREQLFLFTQQVLTPDAKITGSEELMNYTLEQGEAHVKSAPTDARYYAVYGSFLMRTGQFDKAITQFQKAVELSPRKQSLIFELGAAYASKGDFVNAVKYFKQAYDLEPENIQARTLYAASLIYAKDPAATDILKSLDETTLINSDYILQAYHETKQYKKVIEIWQARVKAHPDDAQMHLSLAVAYTLMNDKINAIAEVKKVIQIQPSFKQQGEAYIQQIQSGKGL